MTDVSLAEIKNSANEPIKTKNSVNEPIRNDYSTDVEMTDVSLAERKIQVSGSSEKVAERNNYQSSDEPMIVESSMENEGAKKL